MKKKCKWGIRENESHREKRKKMSGENIVFICVFFIWFTILTFILLVKYFRVIILEIIEFI